MLKFLFENKYNVWDLFTIYLIVFLFNYYTKYYISIILLAFALIIIGAVGEFKLKYKEENKYE